MKPQPAPRVDTPARKATATSPWILGAWKDLVLFVGTPVLIAPLVLAAGRGWTADQISFFVASFGAIGHHLPGMMRAYGDRALFERFKVRFVAAPLFLVAVCVPLRIYRLNGLILILFLWGLWHAVMQTYGFLRIYDSKRGSFAARTCRLDLAMCVAWFGLVILWSPTRLPDVLNTFYSAGGFFLSSGSIEAFRSVWTAAAALITLLFAVNAAWMQSKGEGPSPVKLVLMATTLGFFWYANVAIRNLLLSIALFEIFHDVQYLAVVWMFNRNRADRQSTAGGFTRFLFRPRGSMLGLYLGLVFGYGALNFVPRGISDERLQGFIGGLLAASSLLHFYYDGFIWKVRESTTRRSLGLRGAAGAADAAAPAVGWRLHGLKWALFVAPLGYLGIAELRGAPSELDRRLAVAAACPSSAVARYELGVALGDRGRTEEAIGHFTEALKLQPDYPEAQNNLAVALSQAGRYPEAASHFEAALGLRPRYFNALQSLALTLQTMGKPADAIRRFAEALEIEPDNSSAHNNLGIALGSENRLGEAIAHFKIAVRLHPDFAAAHANLALALHRAEDFDGAIAEYAEALKLQPADVGSHVNAGLALESKGRAREAELHYLRALELEPGNGPARECLERARSRAMQTTR